MKPNIFFALDFYNENDNYLLEKEDSFTDAIRKLSEFYNVFIVSIHRKWDWKEIKEKDGVFYFFSNCKNKLLNFIKDNDPSLINFWGFNMELNRIIYNNILVDVPKTLTYVGGCMDNIIDFLFVDIIFLSTQVQKNYYTRKLKVSPNRFIVNSFTVDTEKFRFRVGDFKYDIIYCSDWREIKRQELLIRTIPLINKEINKKIKVLFIGSKTVIGNDSYYVSMIKLVKELGIEDQIEIIERVSSDEVPYYLREAKIGVHLSRMEGGSRALLEKMATGIPVIVTEDCLTNCSIIKNGITGIIVPPTPEGILSGYFKAEERLYLISFRVRKEIVKNYYYNRMFEIYKRTFDILLKVRK